MSGRGACKCLRALGVALGCALMLGCATAQSAATPTTIATVPPKATTAATAAATASPVPSATPVRAVTPGVTAGTVLSPTAVPPTPRPTVAATSLPAATAIPSGSAGYLEGHASIGPLTPVERVGVPSPTPPPQVCTSRGLAVYAADGTTPVTSFDFQPDCSYRVALAPGSYVVKLKQTPPIGGSKDLPKTVTIEAGKMTRLDVSIDTGIR